MNFDDWQYVTNVKILSKIIVFLVPGDFEGKRITANGERAAQMFCRVECLTPKTTPFTWLFMRPPWAIAGACCKECVFTNMKAIALEVRKANIGYKLYYLFHSNYG